MSCQQKPAVLGSEKDLMTTLEYFNTAFAEGDLDYLDKHTTDDYRHTNSSSKAFGKEAWFNYLKTRKKDLTNGVLMVENYEMTEIEVQLHSNSAFVTGVVHTKGNHYSEAFDRKLRVSHYWVFEEGVWKRAGFHDTLIE
ncbi:nuclear transport factor 2 family protein [Roseivirga sp. E12]|uniref:nuclear transport factor 2 family protein n=1 Tax=Roseivirga sp. E12 TaxID=2819237 RepID=UPI001ABD373A|nr:nuclear transport factor 2 family protein [Roseivirga sp. E12]MBO3699186.1 nuclear transport factor 2 family protein [Roseivirga sp. E12]